MSSSRLPGKVLEPLGKEPLIVFMIRRAKKAKKVDQIALLTSNDPSDDPLADVVARTGVTVVRGPLNDVLERYRMGAEQCGGEVILRLTGDCPLIDPALIDQVVNLHQTKSTHYSSNIDPPSFADGMDIECFSRALLEEAAANAKLQRDREHVTLWMRRNLPDERRSNLVSVAPATGLRLTVDYSDDLLLVRKVVDLLGPDCDYFDVLRLIQSRPEIAKMNPHSRNEALKSLRI